MIENFQTVIRIRYNNEKIIFRISHLGLYFCIILRKNNPKDELDISECGTHGKVTEILSENSAFVTHDNLTILNFKLW